METQPRINNVYPRIMETTNVKKKQEELKMPNELNHLIYKKIPS